MTSISGDLEVQTDWTVFACHRQHDFSVSEPEQADAGRRRLKEALTWELSEDELCRVPEVLAWDGQRIEPKVFRSTWSQLNLRPVLAAPPYGAAGIHLRDYAAWGQVAWVYVPVMAPQAGEVTLGFGGDTIVQAWLDGQPILDSRDDPKQPYPPSIFDYQVTVSVPAGESLLAVRLIAGNGVPVLALGGPRELRAGPRNSIVVDHLMYGDPAWTATDLKAVCGSKEPVDIGSRRELFVDDFLVDNLSGGARLALHPPQRREIVWQPETAWESPVSCYFTAWQDEQGVRLTYSGRPTEEGLEQAACLLESEDGIHFTRPVIGDYAHGATVDTNIIFRKGKAGHNFAPFRDTNPAAAEDQRYKAIAYHPEGGTLAAYGSPDGLHWRMLAPEPVITDGAFDSQNIAFWDSQRGCYFCYYRAFEPRGNRRGVRGIMTCTSEDFLTWSPAEFLVYHDDRVEQLYTNNIRPYPRAPHLYIGTPARFIPQRTLFPEHPACGVSEALLMSSRDGRHFHRWAEAFIRPGLDPEEWTDRNLFPAWGMVQTSPGELSMYWTEHYRHESLRLRRGVLRTDGFVSLQAGYEPGELLTRPLLVDGKVLELNLATAAAGAVRVAVCELDGAPLPGYSLADSEVFFGNKIAHQVRWCGSPDLGDLTGRPVRLRIRLQDADVYSLCFSQT